MSKQNNIENKNAFSRKLSFTDILYGVVISIAITRISLKFNIQNYMLLIALLILIDDWLDYHISLSFEIKSMNAKMFLLTFIIDVSMLLVWNLSAITKPGQLTTYFFLLSIFYTLALAWNFVTKITTMLFKDSYFYLIIVFLVEALIHTKYYFQNANIILLSYSMIALLILRFSRWNKLYKDISEHF